MSRVLLVLVAAVVAALLPLQVAHAAEYAAPDPSGDVVMFDMESEEPVPSDVANGDILRTRFIHRPRAVVITAKYRALSRTGQFRGDFARIVTNEGWKRDVMIFAGVGNWGGFAELARANGEPVRCAISHQLDYADERITVRVPRRCLGRPGWVRVGLGSIWFSNDDTVYVDEALGAGLSDNMRLSPRIRRG